MASSSSSGSSGGSSGGTPALVTLVDMPAGITQDALDAACAAVRGYCGWHIAPVVTESLVLDGPGGDLLMLPTLRLLSVSSVTNDGVAVDGPQWSAAGMIEGAAWTSKFRGVAVTMTHGYAACPDDLRGVIASMATAGVTGVLGQTVGPYSISPSSSSAGSFVVNPAHRQVLGRYQLPSLP